jgi:PTS system nitrogen regulatory IIA component
LGSTGLGFGVALPHGRLAHLEPAIGALLQLQEPVEFDALDEQPVDLLFGLLVPEEATEEHLQLLSLLAEQLGSSTVRERLRATDSPNTAYAILTGMAAADEQT